jgi:hypothetical protein
MKYKIYIGEKFGRLTVISYKNKGHWECLCDCGNTSYVYTGSLRRGFTNSCGCIHKEQLSARVTKHGLSKSNEYKILRYMKDRCYNKNNSRYGDYGGRGIKVCERWLHSVENFVADMGKRPSKKHSIDRIDNNGNYDPDNCKWSTVSEQNCNQRIRKDAVLFDGKNASSWAKELGISWRAAYQRIKRNGHIFSNGRGNKNGCV